MSRTILITGGQGQVGQELARYAWPDGVDVVLPERDALDLADRDNGLPTRSAQPTAGSTSAGSVGITAFSRAAGRR